MIEKKIAEYPLVVMYVAIIWLILSTPAIGDVNTNTTLEYDDYGRLIFVSESTDTGTSQVQYTYDEVGNRTARILPYSVSITCNENGISSHNGQILVKQGTPLEVTITPDDGYAVYNVHVSSSSNDFVGSLWNKCSQASDNTVTLTIEDIKALKEEKGVEEDSLDIEIDFYLLTGLTGDANGDCQVDEVDAYGIWTVLIYRITGFMPYDLNGDGLVDRADYEIMGDSTGQTCD